MQVKALRVVVKQACHRGFGLRCRRLAVRHGMPVAHLLIIGAADDEHVSQALGFALVAQLQGASQQVSQRGFVAGLSLQHPVEFVLRLLVLPIAVQHASVIQPKRVVLRVKLQRRSRPGQRLLPVASPLGHVGGGVQHARLFRRQRHGVAGVFHGFAELPLGGQLQGQLGDSHEPAWLQRHGAARGLHGARQIARLLRQAHAHQSHPHVLRMLRLRLSERLRGWLQQPLRNPLADLLQALGEWVVSNLEAHGATLEWAKPRIIQRQPGRC